MKPPMPGEMAKTLDELIRSGMFGAMKFHIDILLAPNAVLSHQEREHAEELCKIIDLAWSAYEREYL